MKKKMAKCFPARLTPEKILEHSCGMNRTGILAAALACAALATPLLCHAGKAPRFNPDMLPQTVTVTCTEIEVDAPIAPFDLAKGGEYCAPDANPALPPHNLDAVLIGESTIELMPANKSDTDWQNAAIRNETLKQVIGNGPINLLEIDFTSLYSMPSERKNEGMFLKKERKHIHIYSRPIEEALQWAKWHCSQQP